MKREICTLDFTIDIFLWVTFIVLSNRNEMDDWNFDGMVSFACDCDTHTDIYIIKNE